MNIYLNGDARRVPVGMTVAELLESIGTRPLGLAVEINREVIPRSRHAAHVLLEGDLVEIVHMVGGG